MVLLDMPAWWHRDLDEAEVSELPSLLRLALDGPDAAPVEGEEERNATAITARCREVTIQIFMCG